MGKVLGTLFGFPIVEVESKEPQPELVFYPIQNLQTVVTFHQQGEPTVHQEIRTPDGNIRIPTSGDSTISK